MRPRRNLMTLMELSYYHIGCFMKPSPVRHTGWGVAHPISVPDLIVSQLCNVSVSEDVEYEWFHLGYLSYECLAVCTTVSHFDTFEKRFSDRRGN